MTRREIASALSAFFLAPVFKVVEFVALPAAYRPDFLVVLAAVVGWSSDVWSAAPVGFALGLLEDLFVGRVLGMRAMSLALASAISSVLKGALNPDSVFSKAISAGVAAAAADIASFSILRARGINVGVLYLLRWVLPATVAWSAVLAVPVGAAANGLARGIARLWPSPGEGRKGVTA